MSDTETITKNFKRNNLVDMFLRGTEVDEYIINNLYGRGQKLKFDQFDNSIGEMTLLDNLNPDETFTDQIKQIHEQSFAFKQRIDDKDDESQNEPEPKKMNEFETFIAVIKGYCALMILILPRSFVNGGYLFSPMCLIISCAL